MQIQSLSPAYGVHRHNQPTFGISRKQVGLAAAGLLLAGGAYTGWNYTKTGSFVPPIPGFSKSAASGDVATAEGGNAFSDDLILSKQSAEQSLTRLMKKANAKQGKVREAILDYSEDRRRLEKDLHEYVDMVIVEVLNKTRAEKKLQSLDDTHPVRQALCALDGSGFGHSTNQGRYDAKKKYVERKAVALIEGNARGAITNNLTPAEVYLELMEQTLFPFIPAPRLPEYKGPLLEMGQRALR